jgi:hypothetical protein
MPTTPGTPQRTYHGAGDAFVTELNATGTAVLYSTYPGGNAVDDATAIAIDSTGNGYVAGLTQSTDFPVTSGAFQASLRGSAPTAENAFVAKLNANGTALAYSTYLGGTGQDVASGIAVDAAGHAFVTGGTQSADFRQRTGYPRRPLAVVPCFRRHIRYRAECDRHRPHLFHVSRWQ